MKRPEVKLSNYRDVYSFYQAHRQGRRAARFLHVALGIVFKPDIRFATGAREQIERRFNEGGVFVLAANHVRAVDPCVIAAMPRHDETFRPLIGNAFIPSKRSIQAIPVVRHLVDGLGAVPVFREKDVRNEEEKRLLAGATRSLLETAIVRMDSGQHMAIFPEGTRNLRDPHTVQPIKPGVGLMICRVSKIEQPAILPIGIHYDKTGINSQAKPFVYIGNPSEERFDRARDVQEWLPDRLQHVVDQAIQATQA